MTINAKWDTESQEVDGRMQTVAERDEDEIFGDRICNVKEDELRINRTEEDVKHECKEAVQVHQQQQSQGSVFHWERFLHVRSIKVLLVENDDSTRHIVSALLRNLNYEVIVAANGLQALKILQDLTIHIDIILTEVVMPCLSGIGLLCKIMNHKTRKNVPVIMMSSHDSMGLVFECLSKGAVDFLGKPIRKNELKNLWQHVWRRCHSSSGSGSESRTQIKKSVKSKGRVKCDNNISSDDEDDNDSTGLKIVDGSDGDSDTQSSWTKEVDSSQEVSSWDHIAKCSDGTCAQLHSNAKISNGKLFPVIAPKEFQEQEEQIDNVWKGKKLVNGKTRTFKLLHESPNEVTLKLIDTTKISLSKIEPSPSTRRRGKDPANHSGEHPPNEDKAIVPNIPAPQMAGGEYETLSLIEHAKFLLIKNKVIDDSKEGPEVELSLKRLRVAKDTGKAVQTDRNVLRRSDLSSLSRSKTTTNAFKAPIEVNGSSSLVNGSLEIVKNESASDIRSFSNINLFYPNSDVVNNNVDLGSITDKLSINPAVVLKDKLETASAINDLNLSSVSTPMKKDLKCPPQQVILVKTDDLASTAVLAPIRGSPQEHPIQHIHHHHHVHHFHNMDRQQPLPNLDDLSFKKLTADAPHFGSLNLFVGPVEGNTENYSLNKSASGSKHRSNGQDGSSTVVHAGGMNVESDVRVARKSGKGDASGSASGYKIDQNKSAHRQAALTKFRQKKERQFGNNKGQGQGQGQGRY